MNMNIIEAGKPVFSEEIRCNRSYAVTQAVKADAMIETAGCVTDEAHLIASIIARTRPVTLPMTWSIYPENIWKHDVTPILRIHPGRIVWNDIHCVWAQGTGSYRPMEQVTKAAVVIYVTCEPSWETYRRWSSVIIDDFYKAMQAVRQYFGIKWEDISKTQNVSWGEIEFRYLSKDPIHIIRTAIPECERYGEIHTERVTEVRVHFALTVPNFPDDQKNAANCHVVEEEVTTTQTKKVKRLKCE